ncbi:MAG: hypothetical protein IKR39_00880 [Lachnospiraceae bacterium]|nr:hypothetical protein [Lachnospiraceae bacterium]
MGKAVNDLWDKIVNWFKDSSKDPCKDTYEDTKSPSYAAYAACGGFAVLIFVVYYLVAFIYCNDPGRQDMKAHALFAQEFYMRSDLFLKAWLRVPYMLWHLIVKTLESRCGFPLWDAASITFAGFGVFTFAVTVWFIKNITEYYTKKSAFMFASVGSLILSFVGPLSCWWVGDAYGTAFSPNPLHNPTHMAVKGFGFLVLMTGIDIIRKYRGQDTLFFKKEKRLYLYFGIFLFISTITKPTFMYMLLPAGLIVVLIDLVKGLVKKDGTADKIGNSIWKIACASIPSIIYLLVEYMSFYYWGVDTNSSSIIITKPLEVWHMYAEDVPTGIILGMCFPLYMLITHLGYFLKAVEGRLALACYAVGVAEFTLLAESDSRMSAANFSWCMMAGMGVFFLAAVLRLILTTLLSKKNKAHIANVMIGWFLLLLHVYALLAYYHILEDIL